LAKKDLNESAVETLAKPDGSELQVKPSETFDKPNFFDEFNDKLFRLNYYVGLKTVRFFKHCTKDTVILLKFFGVVGRYVYKKLGEKFANSLNRRCRAVITPFREIKSGYKAFRNGVKQEKQTAGRVKLGKYLQCLSHFTKPFSKYSVQIFNYVAPCVGVAILMSTIAYFSSLTFALSVEYSGRHIGYVNNEAEFEAAQRMMKGRIVMEDYLSPEDTIPRFTLQVVDKQMITGQDELTDKLIEASGNKLEEADGLYVDDKFLGASKDGTALLDMLVSMLDQYKLQPDDIVRFVKPIKITKGLYPVSSIIDSSSIQQVLNSEERQQRLYTVKAGDAPSSIAKTVDMPYAQLKALNPDIEKKLVPGQQILISPSVKYLEVEVVRNLVYTEEIPFKTVETVDPEKFKGYSKETQAGKKGLQEVTAEVTYLNGVEVSRVVKSTVIKSNPVDRKVVIGSSVQLQSGSSGLIWPVAGGYVSMPFAGYRGHTGMDIAAPRGTPVYAAASGKVVTSMYRAGYGNYIVIDHGGGIQTAYLHNSVNYVKVGQIVEQGQKIAAVGATGNASGNHSHFEVRVNGVFKNPALYVGNKSPQ